MSQPAPQPQLPPPQQTFDLSGFLALPQTVKVIYQNYWNTFERIQLVNAGVSTLRSAGDKTQIYYQFADGEERLAFINGRMLHIQRYPNSNWAQVPED